MVLSWLQNRAKPRTPAAAAPVDSAAAPSPHAAALEALPDPFLLITREGPTSSPIRILFANAAARGLYAVPPTGGMLASALRRPEVLEAAEKTLESGVEQNLSYETSGSATRYWRAFSRPLPADGTGRRLALLMLRDETDARRSERMRTDFLANASHELRTPLASLTGFIDTLRGHAREDPVARDRFLGIMAEQADRMGRLIDDLLSLSRIELNEHIAPVGRCDLSGAVLDVADALGVLLKAKSVSIELNLAPAGKAVAAGDRDQILQVVQNLVDNAVKYTPPGGRVRVETEGDLTPAQAQAYDPASPRTAANGGGRLSLLTPDHIRGERYVRLRVVDHGKGMAREHLPRLTERFYRVEGQKSGDRFGTGLGLAIVKHIINRHRGGLSVESAPDEGAAFCAYFPMARED